MPCIFIRNWSKRSDWLNRDATLTLFEKLAAAAGVSIDEVEVHLENTEYDLLLPTGQTYNGHGVHVFVEWHEGRSAETKAAMAVAIHKFLVAHEAGKGSDITFRDSPHHTFFYEGKPVEDGVTTRPYSEYLVFR